MISIFFCSNAFFSCLFGSIIQGVYLHAYTGHLYNNFYNDGNEKHSNNTHFFFCCSTIKFTDYSIYFIDTKERKYEFDKICWK